MVKTNIQTFTGEVEVLEEFYVGSNLVANDVATHVLTVNNTANDAKIKSDFFVGDGGLLSNIATTLQSIADQGNAASNVILFNSNTDVTGYKNVGFVTTSNVGIQNTAPTHTMSIGDKIIIDNNTDESQGESVMLVHGRISADRFQGDGGLLSNIATTLESIADQGNASSNVLIFNSNTDISGYRGVGFVTTSNVGIQNTNPGFNTLSVGSNLFVNIYGSNVLTVHGNAAVSNLLVSEFSVSPAHALQHVTQEGRATNETIQLTNTTTGLEVSSNINVAGEVILTNATKGLDVTSNIEIGGRLKFDTNVFVDTLRVADVAANIVTYDRTTGELLDSSGTFMNKFAVVSEQPPSDLFANTTTVTNHGGYTLTTSNLATNSNTYNAFDGTANAWVSGDLAGGYIGGANVFLETNLTQLSNLHPTQFGDWLAIEFPYKTTLRHMKLTPLTAAQFPASANIYATNNDLTWTEINYWSGRNPVTASNVQTITVNATEQFKKYALVATKAAGNSSNVAIQDWQLFTESFSIDGGKVAMAQQAATGGETVMDQHGPHGRGEAKLKKYPESHVTFKWDTMEKNHNTTTGVGSYYIPGGGYKVSASSMNAQGDGNIGGAYGRYAPWQVFDRTGWENTAIEAYGWVSNGSKYSSSDGSVGSAATTTYDGSSTATGEWLELELPNKIKLKRFSVVSLTHNSTTGVDGRMPKTVTLLGSNEGSTWSLIDNVSMGATPPGEGIWDNANVDQTGYYKYIRFVVTSTYADGSPAFTDTGFSELEYYGYEEDPPAGDTSVDTTFKSIMNTPQTTGANVYVDGNLGETFTNRVVGPTVSNTHTTYVSAEKYWELSGNVESNVTLEANTFLSGDAPHSLSMWFNSSNLEANTSNSCIFSVSDQEKLDSVNLDLQSNTWHNLTYAYQGEGGSRVTYLDGRKVAEDQAEDTFGEYPPFAMTGYSQGGYVASASGELSSTDNSHNLFDKDISNSSLWTPSASGYDSSTGAANSTGSITLTNGVQGHWVQLDLPHKLKLNYVGVAASSIGTRYAKDATIFGSNDGVSWTSVGGWTDNAHASNTLKYFTMNGDSGYYNKYRMVITKNGPDAALTLTEWKLYGHRENDLVRLPDPTNVLKYPRRAINASHSAGDNKYINRFDEVSTTSEYSTLGGTYSLVKAFDNVDGTSSVYWSASKRNSISGNLGRYASGAHGAYNGETPTGKSFIPSNATTAQKGEWIKMKSHHKLKLNKIELLSLGTDHKLVPSGVLIWGSDDDSNWNLLKTHVPSGTGGAVTYSNRLGVITVNSTVAYKYHAMVMTHMNNSDSNYTLMSMSQMKFFGTEEGSVPIQIGGGNIDKVANFRVYDKFVGEDQALEIWDAQKDEFGRAKSSMTLQKGRLGIGTDEPQGRLAVADEPHGVEEFPPRAMTGYKNYFEGHGEFCVSANSYGAGSSTTRYPWKAFIKGTTESTSNGDNSWLDGSGDFNNATGVYDGSLTHHNGSVSGEYLQLELPYEIQLSSYSLAPWNYPTGGNFQYSDFPRDFIIYGSKDSISWDIVDTRSGQSSTSQADVPKYHVNSQKTYKYFVIVVTKINTAAYANSAVYVAIGEWRLFGTREQGQSVLHDGQLTLTKSLTVPRIGPALDADDTPRRDRLVVEYNTSTNPTFEGAVRDTSGRGLDGVFYGGVSYDATEKALVFDGTNDYVQTNSPSSLSQIHSMSAWIKMDSQTGINSIMHIGTFDTYKESRIFTSGNVLHATIFGSTVAANSNGMTPSRWYHVVYTFVGGTFNTTNVKLFINGTSVTLTQTQTAATSALTGKTITIGSVSTGGEYFKGDISNPKLYDTALTAEEAKTLYDMGRCDEGHHVVNFSKTRVGIGLGDGEAPLAMLDSRDTRLAFKYGGTTLDNFEEYVHGGPWVGHHSNGSGGFNVHGPIKYQRIGTFCRAHFDFVQYYANGTFYMKADNVPERFRPVTGGDIMTWYTRVYTNGPISSLTYYDPGNTRWVITASVNGSNFNGGNGTNHSIISTSITYRVA